LSRDLPNFCIRPSVSIVTPAKAGSSSSISRLAGLDSGPGFHRGKPGIAGMTEISNVSKVPDVMPDSG
jgi:hypothetical protein